MTIEEYEGATTIAYAVDPVEGARSLVVAFPWVGVRDGRPPRGVARHLEGIHAHRLFLGADEHVFVGPQRELRGTQAAADVIERIAGDLGVDRRDVACFGTSMGACAALLAGLRVGAGLIAAGAPVFELGSKLAAWSLYSPEPWVAHALSMGDVPGRDDGIEFLDRVFDDAVDAAPGPTEIHLLTSPLDLPGYESTLAFAERHRDDAHVTVDVTVGAYSSHAQVDAEFYPWLRDELGALR